MHHFPTLNVRSIRVTLPCLSATVTVSVPAGSAASGFDNSHSHTP